MVCGTDNIGKITNVRLLRPGPAEETILDIYSKKEGDSEPELQTYRIFQYGRVQKMWNFCIKAHKEFKATCTGDLTWCLQSERQRGLCWSEWLVCKKCKYKSELHKLFDEIDDQPTKKGRKDAAPNRALQVGLYQTGISNTAFRYILFSLAIPAPSVASIQVQANKVNEKHIEMNEKDMEQIRTHLLDLNEMRGLARDSPVTVEADTRFNNSLGSGSGKTPLQPATQAVFTVVENVTPAKKIIGLNCKNKLCRQAEKLRDKGQNIVCPNHSGYCSANLQAHSSIGDEGKWSAECFENIVGLEADEPLSVKYFTSDGDSKAFAGFKEVQEQRTTKVVAENLRDTVHMAKSQKKMIELARFSDTMFPG